MENKKSGSLALPNTQLEAPASVGSAQVASNSEFAELKQLLKQRGLLDKQPVYYTYRITLLSALLIAGVCFLLVVHIFWLQLLNAAYLAFVFTQIGLLSHEAGHRQMFQRSWKHDLVSLVGGNLLLGMSYGWWVNKHNRHHSHPNQVDMDPDLEIPFLEFTGKEDLEQLGKFRRFLVKYQAILFFPALMTVSFGLQCNSVKFLLHNKAKYLALEWLLMVVHFGVYLTALFLLFPFWQAVLFIGVHQALTGLYLGAIFAPNHKGMPILDKESKMGFLYRQTVTSRNIHAHPVTDFCYGGLNYQIEHHLFPSMPRNKLKEAQPIIKTYCQEHAIPYHETDAFRSFKEILQHLYHIGASLRIRSA
jgi:fatty acid desaturase